MIWVMKNESHQTKTFVTRHGLAKILQVHPTTIDKWQRQGLLPAYKIGTRFKRYDLDACLDVLESFHCKSRVHTKPKDQIASLPFNGGSRHLAEPYTDEGI